MTTDLVDIAGWFDVLYCGQRTSWQPCTIRAVTWLPGETCARYVVEHPCGALLHLSPGVTTGDRLECLHIGTSYPEETP